MDVLRPFDDNSFGSPALNEQEGFDMEVADGALPQLPPLPTISGNDYISAAQPQPQSQSQSQSHSLSHLQAHSNAALTASQIEFIASSSPERLPSSPNSPIDYGIVPRSSDSVSLHKVCIAARYSFRVVDMPSAQHSSCEQRFGRREQAGDAGASASRARSRRAAREPAEEATVRDLREAESQVQLQGKLACLSKLATCAHSLACVL